MAFYQVLNTQTLEDVCMSTYGNIVYLQKLAFDNANIGSIDADMEALSGQYIYYDEALIETTPASLKAKEQTTSTNIKYYTGIEGQSVYDVAIQKYGTLENIIQLCFDNNLSIEELDNVKDIEFKYNTNLIENTLLVQFFSNLGTGVSSFSKVLVLGKSFDHEAFDKSYN